MYYDARQAEYLSEYRIRVVFENGRSGVVDLSRLVHRGGVFDTLRDIDRFKQFFIHPELKVLSWPGDLDVAPETLYSEATGEPLPVWMTP